MCRIAGIFFKQDPDWRPLVAMQQHQIHGGPDGFGTWNDDHVGLAHNRLSIIDLSENGRQPVESENWVLCYNGEIYNHVDLRVKINCNWKGRSDTETLLNHLEVFGLEATVGAIEGMFAFSAYHKSSQTLYLVTDPLSIKPLYYHADEFRFVFASTIGAIARQVPNLEIDRQSLIDYLALGSTLQPLFAGIRKVMAGTILSVRLVDGKLMQTSCEYWTARRREVSEHDLVAILEKSIESVKISDVPLFLFLSGGIDSSVVAGCLPCIGAVHLASPEEGYAKEVADKFNCQLSIIDPQNEDAEKCLRDYSFKSGDCSMAALIPYITSKHSVKYGKVAISANGADELFYGYPRTQQDVTARQISHIFRREFFEVSSWKDIATRDARELELMTYVTFDLNKTLDYASMCHGLEVRVPFLNRSVIDAALSLDRSAHVHQHGNKSILKKWLLSKGFSKRFVNREKLGFSLHSELPGYADLQRKGIDLLSSKFNINPNFAKNSRDERYYAMSAAAFYCWYHVWF